MRYPTPTALLAAIGGAGCLLAGCSARTEVSLSGNSPAQYSHVYITTQEVWFNTSATAGPDDSGWQKFSLSTPQTVDIVADEDGTLGTIATNVNLLAGSYSQIRLIPMDPSAPLADSASGVGALYNAEADYVDAGGTTVQLPLELLNPDKGIGIQGSLKVPIGSVGSTAVGSTSTTTGGIGTGDATSTTGTTDASTGTTTATGATTTTSSGSSTTTIASFAINIDGNRDLVPFVYGSATPANATNAIMLSSHATAYDLSQVGGIQGTLTLTNLTNYSAISGLPDIQATAETLSADGTRHEVVLSTPVHSDGTFLLYPLPTNTSNPAYYDVVIHGGGIATIIIKAVELVPGTTTTALSAATIPSTDTDTDTTTITPPSVTTVSIGTLIPRAAGTYTTNIVTAASNPLPADTLVGFYETLTASGEVPYVIESSPLDPFNQVLANPQTLSAGTVDSGTYVSSGETVTVVSSAPVQGAGAYTVAGTAPNYADGALTPVVKAPVVASTTSTSTTTTAPVAPSVTVPGLTFASGAVTGSVVAVVTPAAKYSQSGAGAYQGELLVSHEGALVAQVPLDSVLTTAGGGNVLATVPAGTTSSLYYVSVRVWKITNPGDTLSRQWYDTAVDLRSSTSGSIAVTIN
jgi:hypothetical protein